MPNPNMQCGRANDGYFHAVDECDIFRVGCLARFCKPGDIIMIG
jgi:hypothetical protein